MENQEDQISTLVNDITQQRHEIGTNNNNQHQGKYRVITHCCLTQKDKQDLNNMNKNINYGRDGLADYTCRRKHKMPVPLVPQKPFQQPLVGKN